jgi:hypothetical protein
MAVIASEFSRLPALIGVEQACTLLGISRSAGTARLLPVTCRRSGSVDACTFRPPDSVPFSDSPLEPS